MQNILIKLALSVAFTLASAISLAGGGGCGDFCPKFKVTMVCSPIAPIEIVDPLTLTDEWNIRSVDAMKASLANKALKIDLYKTVWNSQPSDPEAFVQAWVEGLVEGESFGKGSEDQATGALKYHGTQGTSTGWEYVLVDLERPDAASIATLKLTSIATHVVLLQSSMKCEPATKP